MRHLIGIGLALVLSAAIFLGGGWAYSRLLEHSLGSQPLPAGGGNFVSNSVVTSGLGAMAGLGVLIGLALLIRWVSPLATGLPGLVLLAWTALYVASPERAVHYIPLKGHSFGLGFEGLGTTGILGAAGLVLVLPLFFPSRWHSQASDAIEDQDDDAIEGTLVASPSSGGLIAGMGSSTWESVTAGNPKLSDSGR